MSSQAQSSVVQECIGVTMRVNNHVILAKNRDRAYKPDLEVVHTRIDGTEVAYMRDITTDWSEGMNEYGIGIVNTALLVGYDEDEKKILKSGGKPSKDGARIRYALSKKTLDAVITAVTTYQGGVKGHTIIASPDAVYTVELTSKHKAFVTKHKLGRIIVRTNHGDHYPDAGYTHADEPEDYASSVERRKDAIALLKTVDAEDEILSALRTQTHDTHSNLNVLRDTKKMRTSSQILMDLTSRTVHFNYIDAQTDTFEGIKTKLPSNYTPKITIKTHKITTNDIHSLKENAMSASKLLSILRTIRETEEDFKGGQTTNCAYEDWKELSEDAEYDGRSVSLNKPFRSNDGKHKFYVYVKNDKGNVIKLGFGDPNMEIKRDDPDRRKAYRDRHNCDNPGPKWKAEYWSCRMWSAKPVSSIAEAMSSIHRIHNGDVVRGTYMNVPYTGFVATQRVHPTNHDIRIFTVKLDAPIVVHGAHMNYLTINASDNPALASDHIALREARETFQQNLPHLPISKLQAKAVLIAVPKNPHAGDGRGFWKLGDAVYRASVDGATDIHGAPIDKRWESSYSHFTRYFDAVYSQHYVKTPEWK